MVALIPTEADAARLAVDGGEPAGQLHVTLRYLGNGEDFDTEDRARIVASVREHAAMVGPVAAQAFGVAVFNPHGDEPAIVLTVGGEGVEAAHHHAVEALAGHDLPEQHTPWCAHLTLHFTGDVALVARYADRAGPVVFDRIRVAFAGEHTDIPLTPPETEPRAEFGGTFLPSRSDPMPDERQPTDAAGTQFTRAYTDSGRNLMDEPPGTPIEFTASTPGVKRDGLDLRASGWRVENFLRSPVVLWCHDLRSMPLGTADATVQPDRLRTPVTFDQEDEFARRVESKVRRRIIRGCSVQWDFVDANGARIDGWRMSPEQLRDEAFYDLLELSIVPVPADPLALAERQRTALRALGTELVALFDEQEHPDSDVTAPELRAAVRAELVRIGLDVDGLTGRAGTELDEVPLPEAGPLVATVDERALARAIRAAFGDLPLLQVDDREPRHRGAIPSHSTAVVEGSWDGPAAVANCAASKSALRGIHAWVDPDGDADAKSSYKFPHHATPGGPANLNGVRNALARLPQAHIPEADRSAVEAHLRRHLNAQGDSDDDGRAHGGTVTTNAHLVGETGPELVLPHTDRTVTTTTASGGTTSVAYHAAANPDDEPPPAGVREPADTPVPPTQDSAARAVVDTDAAQHLLAALTF